MLFIWFCEQIFITVVQNGSDGYLYVIIDAAAGGNQLLGIDTYNVCTIWGTIVKAVSCARPSGMQMYFFSVCSVNHRSFLINLKLFPPFAHWSKTLKNLENFDTTVAYYSFDLKRSNVWWKERCKSVTIPQADQNLEMDFVLKLSTLDNLRNVI